MKKSIVLSLLLYSTTIMGSSIEKVDVLVTQEELKFTLNGNFDLNSHIEIFIDADNNPKTGYSKGAVKGADYLIEDNYIYSYPATAKGWKWDKADRVFYSYISPTKAISSFLSLILANTFDRFNYIVKIVSSDWKSSVLSSTKMQKLQNHSKPLKHQDIITTMFWVGEAGGVDNGYISNYPSAWEDNWLLLYGGVDTPNRRNGYNPKYFIPYENPFYFALPYNDFTDDYKRKASAKNIPWYSEAKEGESLCRNRWIKISKNGHTAYAQWEDAGPFGEDDVAYVFGNKKPKNNIDTKAGLDVSPAVRDYLGLKDVDKTDWEFVDFSQVPIGPWKDIVSY